MNNSRAQFGLMLSALFWGISGILTQIALEEVSTMTLIFFRFLLSTALAITLFKTYRFEKSYLKHGIILASLLMVIYLSSNAGLKHTSASNAGFIIGSNVILVPFINRLFFKSPIAKKVYIKSFTCFIGLALITLKGAKPLNIGDFYCFIDAIAYSLYIIYNSRINKNLNTKKLISIQYGMVTFLSFFYIIRFEGLSLQMSIKGALSIVILSVLCTFLAFYLQLQSQQYISAEKASQILSLIPIFTVIFDMIIMGTILTPAALIGGLLVLSVSVEPPQKKCNLKTNKI